jgi:hypothetical protein
VASPSWYQFLTIAGALTIVNSILIGSTLGLAVQAAGRGAFATSAPIGVITGAGALAGQPRAPTSDLADGTAASVSTTASR